MKYAHQLEVILLKYSLEEGSQRELIVWLRTTAHSIIKKQDGKVKKIHLQVLKYTPAIYLS
jgi:hypothetical protein